jgi:hypothetical protein
MGSNFFFSEKVATGYDGGAGHCQLEMADVNSVPDLRVGPVNAADHGYIIRFEDWEQFERFADAVDSVRSRLEAYTRARGGGGAR